MLILRNATSDVLIEDGKIRAIGKGIDAPDAEVVDCSRFHILPGFVDVHVHFREPGFEYKETIATGSRAAARGGYTTVCTMPNLNPAPDSVENLKLQLDKIASDAVVKVLPFATITKGQKGSGELTDYASFEGLPIAGFSDDGRGVQAGELMEEAMRRIADTGQILSEHCELNHLLPSPESEWREVERNIALSEKTGCPFHVCHVSTKESVELVRQAKARGLNVTCETAPHYLTLCDEDVRDEGRFKMNPPLRTRKDLEALIEGIKDGNIDMIATDHAPHSAEEKSKGFQGSMMGIIGLETAFPVLYTHLVETGIISLEKLVDLMSTAPRRRFGFGGGLEVGQPADLTVVDLEEEYTIDPQTFESMGRCTPFEGWKVKGRVVLTMVDGKIVYKR